MPSFPHGRVAVDYETTGLDPWKGARIFLAGMEDEAGNVLLAEPGGAGWGRHLAVLSDKRVQKCGWNLSFDLLMAREARLDPAGEWHDCMLLAYMRDEYEPDLKLKNYAARHLDMPPTEEQEIKRILSTLRRKGKRDANYSDVPRDRMRVYLEGDLDRTLKAFWMNEGIMSGPQRRVYDIERKVIPNIVDMKRWGVHVDVEYCKRKVTDNYQRMQELNTELEDLAGVKFKHSGPQVEAVMRDLGLDTGVYNEKNGRMKTGREYTRKFADHPFIRAMVELRALEKVTSTYLENFVEDEMDGILHPDFWPFGSEEHGIKSGRFSSNFQQIPGGGRGGNLDVLQDPKMVRRAVTPRPGYVYLFGDFDQIEFTMFACGAGSQRLLDMIRSGVDFHSATAMMILGDDCFRGKTKEECAKLRAQYKEINFALLFGMGLKKYAWKYGLTMGEASERKVTYFRAIPEARDYMMQSQADLMSDGYVQDQFGRRYHVPRDLCYKAANVKCQGPAALVNKRGINRVSDLVRGMDVHPFITVHDELGLEVRRDLVVDAVQALREGMEDRDTFPVPITAKISVAEKNWADKKDWKEEEAKWTKSRKSVLIRR